VLAYNWLQKVKTVQILDVYTCIVLSVTTITAVSQLDCYSATFAGWPVCLKILVLS